MSEPVIVSKEEYQDKVSEHFTKQEIMCPCCEIMLVDVQLISLLELVREEANHRFPDANIIMKIHSWCRCSTHNKAVNGAENSMHLLENNCLAVDFELKSKLIIKDKVYWEPLPIHIMWILVNDLNVFPRVFAYPTFLHVDLKKEYNRGISDGKTMLTLKGVQKYT